MTTAALCSALGCSERARCCGMCKKHYSRWRRHGDTNRKHRPNFDEIRRQTLVEAVIALVHAKLLLGSPDEVLAVFGVTRADVEQVLAERRAAQGSVLRPPRAGRRIGRNAKAPAGTKWCNRCEAYKRISEFGRKRGAHDGLQAWCRPCTREYMRNYHRARSAS